MGRRRISWRPVRIAPGDLGPTSSERGARVGLECPESDLGQILALVVDPGRFFSKEKFTLGDEQGCQRGTPGLLPLTKGDL
jgi:hypothetical protein